MLDTDRDLTELFADQVRRTPDLIALEDERICLTYAELDHRSAVLAGRLRELGVGRDRLVGVLLGRGADHVVTCLAALRAGGAFLVLELAYPAKLLAEVIADAAPTVIVTHEAHTAAAGTSAPVIVLDADDSDDADGIADEPSRGQNRQPSAEQVRGSHLAGSPPPVAEPAPAPDAPRSGDPERLAFVSYSSGTTGAPKGIGNPHRAAVTSYARRFAISDVGPGDRVACNVFFVWETLRPLLRGGTVIAVPDDISYDPVALVDLLSRYRAGETLMTPTLLATVLNRHPDLAARLPDLRTLWLNGEVVTADLARRALSALPGVRVLNVYSASETHEIAAGDVRDLLGADAPDTDAPVCPVGAPLDPGHTYVLDPEGRPVPAGTAGELFVGGDCLARGYLNRPEATDAAFRPDPFAGLPGARMYRTGDRARLRPDGVLEITGRIGSMIKVRGYSIEPGAVQTAVVRHLAVRDCAVLAHGDGLDRRLVAYVVPETGASGGRTTVSVDPSGYSPVARRALADHLAPYMIPVLWVELDALPVQESSGKIDRSRLPVPAGARTVERVGAPETDAVGTDAVGTDAVGTDIPGAGTAEADTAGAAGANTGGTACGVPGRDPSAVTVRSIAALWASALAVPLDAIGADTDFFDLGGHSLALADLARRTVERFGVTVAIPRLAATPTLAGHLEVVRDALAGRRGQDLEALRRMLREDAVLESQIRPDRPAGMRPLGEAQTVLLTGATGFLGAFLLDSLLSGTDARIACLVRPADDAPDPRSSATARLRGRLVELGVWQDALLERIEVVPGDLAEPDLGLTRGAYRALVEQTDVVVHAAAAVNLVLPYSVLRATNVGGTREVLRLACRAGAAVHHVSTNGVLPPSSETGGGWGEDASLAADAVPEALPDGYGQTKWVAEQLVQEAGRRGLAVRVYRPGTISGHSASGEANTRDLLGALIVESLHLGHAPDIDGWLAEMTPVDYVSRAISALADDTGTDQQVFHLGDPDPLPAGALFDRLADLGYPTRRISWDAWVTLWNEKRAGAAGTGDPAQVLRGGMPSADALRAVTVLDDRRTLPSLDRHALHRPRIDDGLLSTYARHYHARGWLPHPPSRRPHPGRADDGTNRPGDRRSGTTGPATAGRRSRPRGRLHGQVAVVTGASSGIGAAVAGALAREGAHVALAARRADALAGVRDGLDLAPGSRALVCPTDVTDPVQVDDLLTTVARDLGPVDIVVSCAGVMYYTLMSNVQTQEWDRTVDVNCKGLLHVLASTVPGMLERGRGHVVAISSDAGRKVFPGLGVYSASKFFVEATLQSLRLETAGKGLRVTSVQPGNVATGLLGMSTDAAALAAYGEPTGARVLDPQDVAGAVVTALCQPEHVAVNEVLIEPRDEPI